MEFSNFFNTFNSMIGIGKQNNQPSSNNAAAQSFMPGNIFGSNVGLGDFCSNIDSIVSKGLANIDFSNPVSSPPSNPYSNFDKSLYAGLGVNLSTNNANAANNTNSSNFKNPDLINAGISALKAGVYGGVQLNSDQVNNAKVIAESVAKAGKGRSPQEIKKAIIIALATAMQESTLNNINYGDRDSVGLFQQRPSCGWGTVEQCTNPEYAATKFASELFKTDFMDKPVTVAAQDVQKSAYPDEYAKWETMATALANSVVA